MSIVFNKKEKESCAFVCKAKGCNASISLEVRDDFIVEPFHITYSNTVHKNLTCKKDEDYFNLNS